MLTSNFLLTLSFLFHLIATVVWIGGLALALAASASVAAA